MVLFFYGKMAPVVEPSGAGADHGAGEKAAAYRSRNYQLEMLEASMKENIIVAVGLFFFFFLNPYWQKNGAYCTVDGYREWEDPCVRLDQDVYQLKLYCL